MCRIGSSTPKLLLIRTVLYYGKILKVFVKDMVCTSFCNLKEVDELLTTVKQLVENCFNGKIVKSSVIGIISPYLKQKELIRQKCERFEGITIGSAETFQAKERPIIIISTVRTGGNCGFLSDARVREFSLFSFLFTFFHSFFKFFFRDSMS